MINFFVIILAIVNGIIWWGFFYYLLYSIKKPINLAFAAFVLVILFSLSILTCPLIMSSMKMWPMMTNNMMV